MRDHKSNGSNRDGFNSTLKSNTAVLHSGLDTSSYPDMGIMQNLTEIVNDITNLDHLDYNEDVPKFMNRRSINKKQLSSSFKAVSRENTFQNYVRFPNFKSVHLAFSIKEGYKGSLSTTWVVLAKIQLSLEETSN